MKKRILGAICSVILFFSCIPSGAAADGAGPLANELSSIGQQTIFVGGSVSTPPTVDGHFHAEEYTWVRTLRNGDAGVESLITNPSGMPGYMTVGIAYDEQFIYLAAVVQENEYTKKGNPYSKFVFNLGFDLAQGCNPAMNRMAMTLAINADDTFFAGNGYMTYSGNGKPNTSWSYLNTLMQAKNYSRGQDADGKAITTYEVQLKKSVLKQAFGVDDLGSAYFYCWSEPTVNGAACGSLRFHTKVDTATSQAFKAAYGWCPTFFGHLVRFERASVSTLEGASIRMANPTGLRFQTVVDRAYYESLIAEHGADAVTFGTLIAPAVYVQEAGAFTKEALNALSKNSATYLDVRTKTPYSSDAETLTFAGTVANILSNHLEMNYAAIGYVEVNGTVVYSAEYTVRNVSEIAIAALKDTKPVQSEEYCYEMKIGEQTVYSPYSYSQRVNINNLAVWGSDSYGNSIVWEE